MVSLVLIQDDNEAKIMWNSPLQHHTNAFLTECLDEHFGAKNKWHVWSIDQHKIPFGFVTFIVVDSLMKVKYNLVFTTRKN